MSYPEHMPRNDKALRPTTRTGHVTLGTDLHALMQDLRLRGEPAQIARWCPNGKPIVREMFGVDHENPLVLLPELGGDGKPVANAERPVERTTRVRKWFAYSSPENYRRPCLKTIARAAAFFQCDVYATSALLLKQLYEHHFAEIVNWRHRQETLDDLLNDEELVSRHREQTHAHLQAHWLPKIWALVVEQGSALGYSREQFQSVLHAMLQNGLHRAGVRSPELLSFAEQQRVELRLLMEGAPEDQARFSKCKMDWLRAHARLSAAWTLHENARLELEHLRFEALLRVGAELVAVKEEHLRLEVLKLKHKLLDEDPALTLAELEKRAQDYEGSRRAELDRQKRLTDLGALLQKQVSDATLSPQELLDYERQRKQLQLRLYRLTHDESLDLHDSRSRPFTPAQREHLREIWRAGWSEVNDFELGYRSGQLGRSQRANEVLDDLCEQARAIWAEAGVDLDPLLRVAGETIHERIAWLERASAALEKEIRDLEERTHVLGGGKKEVDMYRSVVSTDERGVESCKTSLKEEQENLRAEADLLEEELRARTLPSERVTGAAAAEEKRAG